MSEPVPVETAPRSAPRIGLALLVVLAAVILALSLRWARFEATPNFEGSDPAWRALIGQRLSVWGWRAAYESTIWPPLHFWLLGWSQYLAPDTNLGARLPGILLGGLAPWPAFLAASRALRNLAGSTSSARTTWAPLLGGAVAAFLVAVEPLGVIYGPLSYAEVPCSFFLLLACAALIPKADGQVQGGLAVICLAIACGLRYEAWALLPLLLLYLPYRPVLRLAICALSATPTALWILARPRFFALNSVVREDLGEVTQLFRPERIEAVQSLFSIAWHYGRPLLVPLGLLGLFWAWERRETRVLPLAVLASVGFLILGSLIGHVPLFERYLQPGMALLAIGAGVAAGRLPQLLPAGGRRLGLVGLVLLLTLAQLGVSLVLAQRRVVFVPEGVLEMSAELAAVTDRFPKLPVYIDPAGHASAFFYWRGGVPLDKQARLYREPQGDPIFRGDLRSLSEGWREALLISRDGGDSATILALPPGLCQAQRRGDVLLHCLRRFGPWALWRVQPDLHHAPGAVEGG